MNNLSIVHVVNENHKDLINELAEVLGMGVDNLSIKLNDENGQLYWGCHSWWTVEKYILFKDSSALISHGIDFDKYKISISHLYESLINTENMQGDGVLDIPYQNWINTLRELKLTEVE